ncbi:MAG: hypothetical protein ACRC2H_01930 [Silanimonas sp.]
MTPIERDNHREAKPGSVPGSRFRAHGQTTVWAEGAMVHVSAEGPFNREGADAFSQKMVELYRQLPAGMRFVNLTEFQVTMMATPDAWERLASHLQRINESGLPLVATAWVIGPEVEGRGLFAPRGEALFQELGRVFAVFETMADAEAWARERLAH